MAEPTAYYPQPSGTERYVLYACDWTARYLFGGAKVFAFHTIDVQTRAPKQTISIDKSGAPCTGGVANIKFA